MQGGMGDQGAAGAVVSFICHYFLMLILEVFRGGGGRPLVNFCLNLHIF